MRGCAEALKYELDAGVTFSSQALALSRDINSKSSDSVSLLNLVCFGALGSEDRHREGNKYGVLSAFILHLRGAPMTIHRYSMHIACMVILEILGYLLERVEGGSSAESRLWLGVLKWQVSS